MINQERVDELEMAREEIESAIKRIKSAVRKTLLEDRARAYIIPVLEMCCYKDTSWLGASRK